MALLTPACFIPAHSQSIYYCSLEIFFFHSCLKPNLPFLPCSWMEEFDLLQKQSQAESIILLNQIQGPKQHRPYLSSIFKYR